MAILMVICTLRKYTLQNVSFDGRKLQSMILFNLKIFFDNKFFIEYIFFRYLNFFLTKTNNLDMTFFFLFKAAINIF